MLKKHVKWDVTGKCNLRCTHCLTGDSYNNCKRNKAPKELSLKEKLMVADRLKEGGVHLVNLLGGEPLVLGKQLFELSKHCHEIGLRLTLNTNGTLLTEKVAEKLIESGCRGLTISIDGPDARLHDKIRGTGNYNRTIRNLKKLSELNWFDEKVSLTINTVLTKHNMERIGEMLGVCLSLKAHKWILLPLVVTGFAKKNKNSLTLKTQDRIMVGEKMAQILRSKSNKYNGLEIDLQFSYAPLRKLVEKNTGFKLPHEQHCCMAGTTLGFIDPYGNLYSCDRIAREFPDVIINGFETRPMSLLHHTFDEIWNQPFNNELFQYVSSNEAYKNYNPCNRCEYLEKGLCIPCPLYGTRHEEILYDFCLKAERELGEQALRLTEDDRQALFRYSGQYDALQRKKVKPGKVGDKKRIVLMNIKKPVWVRESVQDRGAELYNAKKDIFFQMNYLGKEIWSRVNRDGTSVDEILNSVANLVQDKEEKKRIYNKGYEFVTALLEKELVEFVL